MRLSKAIPIECIIWFAFDQYDKINIDILISRINRAPSMINGYMILQTLGIMHESDNLFNENLDNISDDEYFYFCLCSSTFNEL